MTTDRWLEIKPLLDEALELSSPPELKVFLETRCPAPLRGELETYLAIDDSEVQYLEAPVFDILSGRDLQRRDGEIVGETYRLEEELGHGGMGVVYRATRIRGDYEQQVAVKILKRGCDTRDFVRRFRRERQILARLPHPNITRLIDGGATEDGLPYLVMELVHGETLDVYCERKNASLEERIWLIGVICQAVQQAHALLVVHCDLKPSNILVTEEGEPKVLDFGIAKALVDSEQGTQTSALRLGTPPFASPEQRIGETISTGSDIYALGAVLHLLVVGEAPAVPSPEDDRLPRLGDRLRDHPEAMERLGASGRPKEDLDAVMRKALAWDPAARYASPAEMAADLGRWERGEPVLAKSYTWLDEVRLLLRRRRSEALITLAASLLLAVLGVFAADAWLEAESQGRRAEAHRKASIEVLDILIPDSRDSVRESIFKAQARFQELGAFDDPRDRAKILDRLGRLGFGIAPDEGGKRAGLELQKQALEIRSRFDTSREDVEDHAASLNNVALAEKRLGNHQRAAELYEKSLVLFEAYPDMEGAELADLLNNLGTLNRTLGRFDMAESYHRRALELRRALFGEQNRDVEESLSNLGQILMLQERFLEASESLEKAFSSRRDRLGPTHPKTLKSRRILATNWLKQGRLDAAVDAFRALLAAQMDRVNPSPEQIARSRLTLAMALLDRGADTDLGDVGIQLNQAESALSDKPSDLLWLTRQQQGRHLLAIGRPAAAEPVLKDNLEASWTPGNAYRREVTRSLLGQSLLDQGRIDEARPLLKSAMDALVDQRGAQSTEAAEAARRFRQAKIGGAS